MNFPKPDRSNYTVNQTKSAENDQIDIGWAEGVLRDGRPFRLEVWAQDQITCLTVFLSSLGLEDAPSDYLVYLLRRDSVVAWLNGETASADASLFVDAAGNEMWSVNVVIGVDDSPASCVTMPINGYSRPE